MPCETSLTLSYVFLSSDPNLKKVIMEETEGYIWQVSATGSGDVDWSKVYLTEIDTQSN